MRPNYESISDPDEIGITSHESEPSPASYHGATNSTETESGNFWGMLLVAAFLMFFTIGFSIISYQEGSTLQWFISRYIALCLFSIMAWLFNKPETHRRFYGDTTYDALILFVHAVLENMWVYPNLYALHTVYIGDLECIFLFVAPNVIALIGRFFFKEQLPKCIAFILVIDLVGVILVTQPSFIFPQEQSISVTGVTVTIVASIIYALDVSIISHNEQLHWIQLQISSAVLALGVVAPTLYVANYFFSASNVISGGEFSFATDMIVFNVVFGITNVLSQICMIYGYQLGASTKVVWLEYVNLLFACSVQWIVLQDVRNLYEIIGALLVISTVFVLFFQQYKAYQQETQETGERQALLSSV